MYSRSCAARDCSSETATASWFCAASTRMSAALSVPHTSATPVMNCGCAPWPAAHSVIRSAYASCSRAEER
ncbi:hypothetical protein SALBM135S_02131 [Streptomyces alboniger]